MKISAITICALISCPPFAILAQTSAPAPQLKPADTWTYRAIDGYTKAETEVYSLTVTEVNTKGYAVDWESRTTGTKAVRTYTKDWNPVARGGGLAYTPYYPYFKFPLLMGKAWSGDSTLTQESSDTQWIYSARGEVVGFGKVTVRAGEFDAYEISNKATYTGVRPGAMNWSGWRKETLWYAPAAKAIIKLKSEQSKLRSDTPSFTIWELQTYTLH